LKNKGLIRSWDKIEPDHNAKARMLNNILNHAHSDETQKRKAEKNMKKSYWKIFAPVAACAVMALVLIPRGNDDSLTLSRSSDGIRASYVQESPDVASPSIKLVEMTEEELFNNDKTDIFSGTVKDIRNIEILMGGEQNYYTVVEIDVDKVFRGSCVSGDVATILLDYPLNMEGMEREDTNVTSNMTEGMKGIFMPIKYDESAFLEVDGEKLYWTDLADFSFPDGERYAFLETEDGLIFDRYAYASTQNAESLEAIEEYVKMMLGDDGDTGSAVIK
jgi:hypothetical protein